MCPTEPFVLSGDSKSSGSIIKQTGEGGDKSESPYICPRGVYHGHDDTCTKILQCLVTDSCLILWDARTGTSPVTKVEKAHDANLHVLTRILMTTI
uniref:Uncharacterized protein n=1 Tax=Brassica oleracea var. oleracea TaxID=109376 RepID=A0A0D3BG00_BRAOL